MQIIFSILLFFNFVKNSTDLGIQIMHLIPLTSSVGHRTVNKFESSIKGHSLT